MITKAHHRPPAYFRMLCGILVAYALIIGFGDTRFGDPARIVLLSYLLWTSARLHSDRKWRRWAWMLAVTALVASGAADLVDSPRVLSAVIGGSSVALIGMSVTAIGSKLRLKMQVDIESVLGVLCIYLLLALLFASVNQVFAAIHSPYLHGVPGSPSASDLLYFSVITLTTVGYGDLSPASEVARAVSVVEALTGQLYLVSVVAGVVAGWRGGSQARNQPDESTADEKSDDGEPHED